MGGGGGDYNAGGEGIQYARMLGGELKSEGAQLMDPDDYVFGTPKADLYKTQSHHLYTHACTACAVWIILL